MEISNQESESGAIIGPRSGVAVAGALLVANLCNYAFQIVTGRLLSVEEYGLLAGFMSAVTIITVSTSALQTTAARSIAAHENERGNRQFFDGLTRTAVIGALVFGALIGMAAPILSRFFNIGSLPILLLGVYVLPAALDSIAAGRLQGSQRFTALAAYSASQAIAKLCVASLLILAGFRVSGLVGGLVISSGAIALLGMFASRDAGSIGTHALGPEVRRGFLAFLLFWVILSIDIAFARAFFEPRAAGVYAAAAVLGKAVLWLPTMVTQLLFPHLADRSARGQKTAAVMGRAVLAVVGLASSAVIGLYLLRHEVFDLLYGDRYDGAGAIAWQIGLAMIPMSIVNLLLFHSLSRGEHKFLAWMGAAVLAEVAALYVGPKTGLGYASILGLTGLGLLALMLPRTAWGRIPWAIGMRR